MYTNQTICLAVVQLLILRLFIVSKHVTSGRCAHQHLVLQDCIASDQHSASAYFVPLHLSPMLTDNEFGLT